MSTCILGICCLRRTILERILLVLVAILALTVIILAAIIAIQKGQAGSSSEKQVHNRTCQTKTCVETAAKVLSYMDASVDPCDDFYEFTCGTFIKNAIIPDEMSEVSTFYEIQELLTKQLRIVIEEPSTENEPKAFALAKKYYQTCMDIASIESVGLKDIKAFLKQFGGWPVLEGKNFDEEAFDWLRAIAEIDRQGFSSDLLVSVVIYVDSKNSTKRILTIEEAELGLDRAYLTGGLEDDIVKAYHDYMVNVAVLFGSQESEAKDELLKSLKFEIELAEITAAQEDRQDPLAEYNPISLKELEDQHKFIPWTSYINLILAPYGSVTGRDIVSVAVPKYLSELGKLISKTPKRVLANYIMWRTVNSKIICLPKALRQRKFEFASLVSGRVAEEPRWKKCISHTNSALDIATSSLYARKYFPESAKNSVEALVTAIQDQFKESLQTVDWMDESTRNNALQKLASMRRFIAYPNELLDDAKVDEFFKTLELDGGSFLNTSLKLNKFYTRRSVLNLQLPVNKTDWTEHCNAAVVNAFYTPSGNSIQFPAGILQGMFFHKDRPNYMNYGGIGSTVGHEITHGFDSEGRQYDKDGNIVNWWAKDTENAFEEKANCVVDQYNNYKIPEINMNVNGKLTLAENIADIGGTKEAYMAYRKFLKRNGEELRLPGLNYTGRQMFWISAGINWCTKIRKNSLKTQVLTDDHSPEKYRIWGAVSNMAEFAEDFNCKRNTSMNPSKKCFLW